METLHVSLNEIISLLVQYDLMLDKAAMPRSRWETGETHLSSWAIPLWMEMAGKFCSTRSWDRAIQRWIDLTKITTYRQNKGSEFPLQRQCFRNHLKKQQFFIRPIYFKTDQTCDSHQTKEFYKFKSAKVFRPYGRYFVSSK